MEAKNLKAVITIGSREITVPVHEELVKVVELAEASLNIDSRGLSNFVSRYISARKVTANLRLGNVTVPFDIPAYIADAVEFEVADDGMPILLTDEFGKIIRGMIPSDMQPASEKQLWYAKKIALTLGLEFPKEAGLSITKCSDFISEHQYLFLEHEELNRTLATFGRKAGRGYLALCLNNTLADGEAYDDILLALKIRQVETLQKYLNEFNSFLSFYELQEPNHQKICIMAANEVMALNYPDINCKELTHEIVMKLIAGAKSARGGNITKA
jgi:hypothetical protein